MYDNMCSLSKEKFGYNQFAFLWWLKISFLIFISVFVFYFSASRLKVIHTFKFISIMQKGEGRKMNT